MRVALWCQHRSCLHPANYLITVLLSQRCSVSLTTFCIICITFCITTNHWYSLISVQRSRMSPPKCSVMWCAVGLYKSTGHHRGVNSSVCLGDLWHVDRTSSPLPSLLDTFSLDRLSRAFHFASRSFLYCERLLQRWFRSAVGQ